MEKFEKRMNEVFVVLAIMAILMLYVPCIDMGITWVFWLAVAILGCGTIIAIESEPQALEG